MEGQVTTAIEAAPQVSSLFVVVMGICTVFIGLACIIGLCYLMSYVLKMIDEKKIELPKVELPKITFPKAAPAAAPAAKPIENRGELVAAISAAVAEELGKDVSGIRILSIKRL